MKGYFKRMTCLLVVFTMLAGLLPQRVFANGTEDADKNLYTGKVISVLGDSISTFAGYIPTADGFNLEHLARYPQDNLLTDVNETWWMQVIAELDAKLGINDSWRGATVSGAAPVTTGTSGENASMANLTRIQNLGANGTPDVILFYGGTNDLAHVSKVGSFDAATAPAEVDLTTKKWDNLADGYVHTLLRLQHYYPNAQIVALLPAVTTSYYSDEKLAQANAVLSEICTHYGVAYTDLRECGLSTSDLPDGIHPNAAGMDYITDAVLDVLTTSSEMIAGENVVYAVTHELTNAKASKSYYKGISAGETFAETISGENLTVTVTMDGEDITDECYADGEIHIETLTGDISVQAEAAHSLGERLQVLPETVCAGTNLWTALSHDKEYYTANGWGVHASGNVYSVTIPVDPEDQIWATSFQESGTNGGTINGIRVTWFSQNGVLESVSADRVYAEFTANGGYLLAPEGTVAVNIPMWNNSDENELYILNAKHEYDSTVTAPTCTEVGYTTYTCHCGITYTVDEVEALDHRFGVYAPDNNATCTADGTKTAKCENCEETDTVIDVGTMKDHTYTDAEDADCNACGYVRETAIPSVPMFRMYDPNGGEHFYTGSEEERDLLKAVGWDYEGVAFNFPVVGAPVHRLYNPTSGDHLYTMDEDEMTGCLNAGWNYEGVAFNSAAPDQVPQYRLWNPNAIRGAWHFTGSTEERDWLLDLGWQYQGIGWYSEWV